MALFSDTDVLEMVKSLGAETTATYTPVGGDPKTVYIIFFNAFQAIEAFGESVANKGPMAVARESDMTGTVKRGILLIGSTTYNILNPRSDGEGFLEMNISKVAA